MNLGLFELEYLDLSGIGLLSELSLVYFYFALYLPF